VNWKIPLWSAGIGVGICAASLAYTFLVDWNVHLYNPAFENVIFYLCPATILQIATADAPVQDATNQRLIYELWVIAAVVNALLYGLIGLIFAIILHHWKRKTVAQNKCP
jgi:F0F1-type ATP synthase membrane subunit c/vacuolar-type H+-ATPase subunit K